MDNYLHIEEERIKQLLFYEESISEKERKEIFSHLNTCDRCKEIYERYQDIISEINSDTELEPTENDKELARKISSVYSFDEKRKLLPEKKSYVQISENNFEIINVGKKLSVRYFIDLIKYNPIKSAASFVLAGAILSFLLIIPSKISKDNNPVFADVENKKLKVYNKESDLLWEKGAFGIPDSTPHQLMSWQLSYKKFISIEDIDGDGINEVLISGDRNEKIYSSDSVYCFDNYGELKWIGGAEKQLDPSAPKWKNTGRFIRDFFTIKNGEKRKLFFIGNDNSYAAAFVSEINPENGKVITTLYHSGWFSSRINVDLDNDGTEEIIIGGISSFDKPCVLVIKTDNVKGVMPDLYSSGKNYEKGRAYAYILFSTRDLSRLNNDFTLGIDTDLKKLNINGFYVNTADVYVQSYHKTMTGILYAFNNNLEINNISFSSEYSLKYNQLYKAGLVKEKLDSVYCKMLKDSVLYWDGDKFVHYPVKNKYYNIEANK